jgi:hypothetical protein
LVALTACDDVATGGSTYGPFIATMPEAVTEIVPPNQNLTQVKVDPVDGCFVYLHVGPVETTFLPLRSAKGNPICTRPASEPAPAS